MLQFDNFDQTVLFKKYVKVKKIDQEGQQWVDVWK